MSGIVHIQQFLDVLKGNQPHRIRTWRGASPRDLEAAKERMIAKVQSAELTIRLVLSVLRDDLEIDYASIVEHLPVGTDSGFSDTADEIAFTADQITKHMTDLRASVARGLDCIADGLMEGR